MKHRTVLAVAALATSMAAASAHAQPTQVIPYDGYLESNGEPVNGEYAVRFTGYDRASGGSVLFTEEWSDEGSRSCDGVASCVVSFYAGSFRVMLGTHGASIPTSGTRIFLEVEVRDISGTWVALAGRQEILAAPYTLWTADADALVVGGTVSASSASAGTLTVASTGTIDLDVLEADGEVTTTSFDSQGATTVTGALRSTTGSIDATGDVRLNTEIYLDDGAAIEHTSGDTLTIDPDGHFTDVVFENGFYGLSGVEVDGNIYVDHDVRFGGTSNAGVAEHDHPIVTARYRWGDTNTGLYTNMESSRWFCFIGGHRFTNGDLNESNTDSDLYYVYAYDNGSAWRIRSNIVSHSDEDETHEVEVICVQRGLVDIGTTLWTE